MLAALLLSVTPVLPYIPHGSDEVWTGHLENWISVSDNECDGHTVQVQYQLLDGKWGLLADENGCEPGPGIDYELSAPIELYSLCEIRWEEGWSCTKWKSLS